MKYEQYTRMKKYFFICGANTCVLEAGANFTDAILAFAKRTLAEKDFELFEQKIKKSENNTAKIELYNQVATNLKIHSVFNVNAMIYSDDVLFDTQELKDIQPQDISIVDLYCNKKITQRVFRALMRCGEYVTIGDIGKAGKWKLHNCAGIGKLGFEEVEKALKEYGIPFDK